jgi:hypothetical protein
MFAMRKIKKTVRPAQQKWCSIKLACSYFIILNLINTTEFREAEIGAESTMSVFFANQPFYGFNILHFPSINSNGCRPKAEKNWSNAVRTPSQSPLW